MPASLLFFAIQKSKLMLIFLCFLCAFDQVWACVPAQIAATIAVTSIATTTTITTTEAASDTPTTTCPTTTPVTCTCPTTAAPTTLVTTMSTTPPTTTPVPICNCPAGSAGVIFPAGDPQYFQFPAPAPATSATCGGCPNGFTKSCFGSTSSTFNNAIASIDVLCNGGYNNFCACPSNGQPCFTFGQNNGVFDLQLYSVCDASGVCQIFLVFFSSDNTDFISNGIHTVTYVGTTDGAGNQLDFFPLSPYPKAPTFAVSCDGCGAISTTGTNTGTAVTCTGPLTTNG